MSCNNKIHSIFLYLCSICPIFGKIPHHNSCKITILLPIQLFPVISSDCTYRGVMLWRHIAEHAITSSKLPQWPQTQMQAHALPEFPNDSSFFDSVPGMISLETLRLLNDQTLLWYQSAGVSSSVIVVSWSNKPVGLVDKHFICPKLFRPYSIQ